MAFSRFNNNFFLPCWSVRKGIRYEFTALLWQYAGAGGWHFVSLPKKMSKEIRKLGYDRKSRDGPVAGYRNGSDKEWKTAIWFDTKQDTYLLPVKERFGSRKGWLLGNKISTSLWIWAGLHRCSVDVDRSPIRFSTVLSCRMPVEYICCINLRSTLYTPIAHPAVFWFPNSAPWHTIRESSCLRIAVVYSSPDPDSPAAISSNGQECGSRTLDPEIAGF